MIGASEAVNQQRPTLNSFNPAELENELVYVRRRGDEETKSQRATVLRARSRKASSVNGTFLAFKTQDENNVVHLINAKCEGDSLCSSQMLSSQPLVLQPESHNIHLIAVEQLYFSRALCTGFVMLVSLRISELILA